MTDLLIYEIVKRRFGRDHTEPCGDPTTITCAKWECQKRNRCKHLALVTLAPEGENK